MELENFLLFTSFLHFTLDKYNLHTIYILKWIIFAISTRQSNQKVYKMEKKYLIYYYNG